MDYEEALLQVTDVLKAHNRYHMNAPDHEKAVEAIRDIVTPKGKWIWEEEWLPSTTEHPAECQYAGWVCNQCHEFPTDDIEWDDIDEKPQFEYCPNCGARMREVTYENY